MREPWWRKQNRHWYLEVDGRQVRLSTEPDPDGGVRKAPPPAVQTAWHKLMREGVPAEMRLGDLVATFLDSLPAGDNKDNSRRQLARFERYVGREAKVSQLRPIKLTEYLRKHPHWKPSSVRTCVNRAHACLNWGVGRGSSTATRSAAPPATSGRGGTSGERGC